MNRYKFRAWHKNNKCMCQNVTTDLLNRDYLEFMQYVGLKDSYKEEIYENDIIKAVKRIYINEGDRKKLYETFRVTYLNGCYMFGNWNAHEFFNRFIYIEVVGNKFEDNSMWEDAH